MKEKPGCGYKEEREVMQLFVNQGKGVSVYLSYLCLSPVTCLFFIGPPLPLMSDGMKPVR